MEAGILAALAFTFRSSNSDPTAHTRGFSIIWIAVFDCVLVAIVRMRLAARGNSRISCQNM